MLRPGVDVVWEKHFAKGDIISTMKIKCLMDLIKKLKGKLTC